MSKYKVLEHTADLKIEAQGKTLEEVFENMAMAMFSEMEPDWTDQDIEREIKIESTDIKSLLVDFLNELVTQADINQEAYEDFKVQIVTETPASRILNAYISGRKIKGLELEIKAVTYNDLEIKKEKGVWQATVVFDI